MALKTVRVDEDIYKSVVKYLGIDGKIGRFYDASARQMIQHPELYALSLKQANAISCYGMIVRLFEAKTIYEIKEINPLQDYHNGAKTIYQVSNDVDFIKGILISSLKQELK